MAYFMGSFSVSPASAGMIPRQTRTVNRNAREPRIRGDDPFENMFRMAKVLVSPASAGMIPSSAMSSGMTPGEPRIRGDDPGGESREMTMQM